MFICRPIQTLGRRWVTLWAIQKLEAAQQFGQGDFKAVGQCFKNAQTGFPPSVLQFADVNASNPRNLSQVSLTPSPVVSEFSQPPTETRANIDCHPSRVNIESRTDVVHAQHRPARTKTAYSWKLARPGTAMASDWFKSDIDQWWFGKFWSREGMCFATGAA
jgi:hypothetical protein